MHHQQRAGGGEFDGEVAVGNGIQRVFADAVEAELFGDEFAVDRVGRAGQRGGAERQAVGALAGIGEALGIAAEHFEIGQHVVAEGHRLGDLQVREAGHRRRRFLLGQIDQRRAEGLDQHEDVVDRIAQVEADVGGHLVVARAAGVQALAGIADERGQALFDIEVHVFEVERPCELARLDFLGDDGHAALDVGQVGGGDDALLRQHPGVRQRAADILAPHALVEVDRSGVAFDEIGNRLGESSGPSVLCGVGCHKMGQSRR